MKYSAVGFFIILFNTQAASAENRLIIGDNESPGFSCEAILEKDTAKFSFIDEAVIYENGLTWNDDPSSAIEYSWLVFFNEEYIDGSVVYKGFDIGIRYFARDDAPSKGTLLELFSISDIHGFAYENNNFIPIYFDNNDLNANIVSSNVELVLRRGSSTAFFFNAPPEQAYFWVLDNKRPPRKCLAKIIRTGGKSEHEKFN